MKIPSVNLCDIFGKEIETKKIKLKNVSNFSNNIDAESLIKICLIVKFLNSRKIFEFEGYNGTTTLQMAINTKKNCKIYSLNSKKEKYISHNKKIKILSHFNCKEFYNKIDFIFINTLHNNLNKKNDWDNSFKMLSKKGIIAWNNYLDPTNSFVTKYLLDLNLNLYHLKNTKLVVYKSCK